MFNFSAENCKNCYKCVRSCPVKAIRFTNDKAEIDEDKCIACGQCFVICPKHAINVENDVDRVMKVLDSGKKVYACIDSSYIGTFDSPGQFVAGLKKLGFYSIQEIAVGSEIITEKYKEYVNHNSHLKYIISSSCPSIYIYIRKYYPDLIQYLVPVVTPMLALGKAIKKQSSDNYTVYIGPCLSKKHETLPNDENSNMNSLITFIEIMRMFRLKNINIREQKSCIPDVTANNHGKHYSIAGDLWPELKAAIENNHYDIFHVNGLEDAKSTFEALEKEEMEKAYISISACEGSCINGPFLPKHSYSVCSRKQKIKHFSRYGWGENDVAMDWSDIDFGTTHSAQMVKRKKASAEELNEILKKMNKNSRADELDCGACGYDSCREKAQAVYDGMAQVEMCMPYMRSKAENMSDMIFLNSRNIVIVLDSDLIVKQFNPTAENAFGIKAVDIMGKPISNIMEDHDFRKTLYSKSDSLDKKVKLSQFELVVIQNLIYIKQEQEIIVTMQNVTEDESRREELDKLRKQTVEIAQNVIEKQMKIAQEIASLLGETTAETKVALNKLKDVVLKEGD